MSAQYDTYQDIQHLPVDPQRQNNGKAHGSARAHGQWLGRKEASLRHLNSITDKPQHREQRPVFNTYHTH